MVPLTKFSDQYALISTIDPATIAGTTNGDSIDMKMYHRVVFIIAAGALAAANATLTLTINGDSASGGSYATAITGKATAAGTFSGSADDNNKQAMIEVDAAEVEAQGLRYIRPTITVTNGGGDAVVIALGSPRYVPAIDYDLASVAEIVS